jgi:hypothetical protein
MLCFPPIEWLTAMEATGIPPPGSCCKFPSLARTDILRSFNHMYYSDGFPHINGPLRKLIGSFSRDFDTSGQPSFSEQPLQPYAHSLQTITSLTGVWVQC